MELVKFDAIQHQIATAKDIQTLSMLSDKIQAIQILAKQSHQSVELQNEIVEYRIKVDKKQGEWYFIKIFDFLEWLKKTSIEKLENNTKSSTSRASFFYINYNKIPKQFIYNFLNNS